MSLLHLLRLLLVLLLHLLCTSSIGLLLRCSLMVLLLLLRELLMLLLLLRVELLLLLLILLIRFCISSVWRRGLADAAEDPSRGSESAVEERCFLDAQQAHSPVCGTAALSVEPVGGRLEEGG